jgi:hypothetical protein
MVYTYAVSSHAPTYPAVEELRPEDVNPDPSRSRPAGSASNILLQPEKPLRITVLGITMFISQHAARLNPFSSLMEGRHRKSSRQVETPFLVHSITKWS